MINLNERDVIGRFWWRTSERVTGKKREQREGAESVYTWLKIQSASELHPRPVPPPKSHVLAHVYTYSIDLIPFASEQAMLEAFEILTTSGVVLWSKSYAPVGAHVINGLINDVFIEEKVLPQNPTTGGVSPAYKKEKYTLKWKRVKEFDLIFVVRLSHAPAHCLRELTLSL